MRELRTGVVGGGISGLVAATNIARSGRSCVLLEAAAELGGRARTRVQDGFHFNQGPHGLYVAGALNKLLREWDIAATASSPDLGAGVAVWDGSMHPLPVGASLKTLTPLDASSRDALIGQFKRIAAGDYDGRGEALSSVTRQLPFAAGRMIEALVRVSTYAHAPDLLDAKAALDQVRLSFKGVLYHDGGWQTLVDGLVATASAAGATLRTGYRVATISRMESGWVIEAPPNAPEQVDAVILAVPPNEAGRLARDVSDIRVAASRVSAARISGLDLGLEPGVRPSAPFALGMTAPTYFSVHSDAAKLTPEGGTLVHLARYLAPDERPDANFRAELEALADTLLPHWRSFEARRQQHIGMVVGYDIPSWSMRGRRTPGHFANVPGLFLAGDWIGDEGMLADAAAASGRAAARQALSFLSGLPPR